MRVPTYTQFKQQLDSMSNQYSEIDAIQAKINSGKKIDNSSEDPILAIGIKATQDYINELSSYKSNIMQADNRVGLVESSTKSTINALDRISELIRSAQSDISNETDRKNIAQELKGLLSNMISFSNTTDSTGNFIFSGNASKSQAFSKVGNEYVYTGSMEESRINISKDTSTLYSESGQKIFGDIRVGNGVFSVSGSSSNTGSAETSPGSLTSSTEYVEDTYTITFVTNSGGNLAYQVVGAASGQIIPAPPATTPADAPEYISNGTIKFNGVAIEVTGSPNINDQFVLEPSKKQNIFTAAQELINILDSSIVTGAEKAVFNQKISQLSSYFVQASRHFSNYLSDVGYHSVEIDNQIKTNEASINNQKIVLGKMSDADLSELAPQLYKKMLSMEMTQKSYVKLQEFFNELLKSSI